MNFHKYKNQNIKGRPTTAKDKSSFRQGGYWVILIVATQLFATSCKKPFLDVVPDNVATIDNAFASKTEAEKYLFTCYNYLPIEADPTFNVGLSAGDEVWVDDPANHIRSTNVLTLPKGAQNTSDPIANYMNGTRDAQPNFKAIRACNIFIENVSDLNKIRDLNIDMRVRWIAEAQFLKAFYHFMLFRAYGPIPIIDKNLPINAPIEQARVKRQPVDSVVNYIANLLNVAAANLPLSIVNKASELGRITKPVALSLKARLLATAASPLYNGNSDYGAFKNKDGMALFNPTYSKAKWDRAAEACKAAIDLCTAQNIKLYVFPTPDNPISDTTMKQMSIRNAMSERWNSELIWGVTVNNSSANNSSYNRFFQTMCVGQFDFANLEAYKTANHPLLGPTLKMAKMFYTQNGVPIDEDKTLDFTNIASLRKATRAERFNIKENETTARLNFDREPRYYASLGFDRGIWYMANSPSKSDENTFWLQARGNEKSQSAPIPIAGFYMKKALNWQFDWNSGSYTEYPWPEIRLADLYLLYAESLNEANGPNANVYDNVNKVRARAGLQTVESSWTNFSINPTKYTTKEGMRSIIQRERSLELCFEGQRYWDLLRWKTAAQELNSNVTGWTIGEKTPELYYREKSFISRHFIIPRDYLWPIQDKDLLVNENLVQNPNW